MKSPIFWMKALGYSGLIPFWGLAAFTALNQESSAISMFAHYNLIYGVAIISFLGAVHWGIAMTSAGQESPMYTAGVSQADFETRCFVWGVTPAVLAWIAASFSNVQTGLWLLALILLAVWLVDTKVLGPLKIFKDYLKLRQHLSLGAMAGLLVTAWLVH